MRVAGIEYPYISQAERDKRKEFADAIRATLDLLNVLMDEAKPLDLKVEIKKSPECEFPTPAYRVEITQTTEF